MLRPIFMKTGFGCYGSCNPLPCSCKYYDVSFSGFSVSCCINEEKGYLLPTWAWKITFRHFNWMLVIRAKVAVMTTIGAFTSVNYFPSSSW